MCSTPSSFFLSRRQLMISSAATLAASAAVSKAAAQQATPSAAPAAAPAASKTMSAYAAPKDPANFIIHSSSTIETKRNAFGTSVVTPANLLYVRNNLPAPEASILADRDAWELSVEGVGQARKLKLRELKSMEIESLAMVLQCSGNGRGFFPSKPSGTPWGVGAAGCVVWSGVPVRKLVEELGGVAAGMQFMTGTGGEKLPEGIDPKTVMVERSVPLAAMADALLAWEMNGEPLSLAHGGPLRLIMPGYTGVNSIKYIKQLAFTAKESDARIMSHGYRISPVGGKGDPNQPSVQEMSVKSWINGPGTDGAPLLAGRTQIHGVAFGGMRAVSKVEVSVDGGKSWKAARFMGPDLGKYAWRQFVLTAYLAAGDYNLVSRATDSAGNVQPEQRLENASGYNNTSWLDHAVKVTVT
jgi:sulfite oxidase